MLQVRCRKEISNGTLAPKVPWQNGALRVRNRGSLYVLSWTIKNGLLSLCMTVPAWDCPCLTLGLLSCVTGVPVPYKTIVASRAGVYTLLQNAACQAVCAAPICSFPYPGKRMCPPTRLKRWQTHKRLVGLDLAVSESSLCGLEIMEKKCYNQIVKKLTVNK